jgi:hypothetical protein
MSDRSVNFMCKIMLPLTVGAVLILLILNIIWIA